MKTTIYIDGYNFYYSRLKGTPFKWLDIVVLFRDLIDIIQGFHVFEPTTMPAYQAGSPPQKQMGHRVWLIEEKQTDVNMALHIYRDALRGDLQQQIICTNDSDLEPALKMVKADAPHMTVGLVMPLRPLRESGQAASNKRLTGLAHWTRKHILDGELENAQLATSVPTRKKPAIKPAHWF